MQVDCHLCFIELVFFLIGPFQIKKIKRSDAALRGELMPYNIIPLDSSSVGNVVGFFPEVPMVSILVTGFSFHALPNILSL